MLFDATDTKGHAMLYQLYETQRALMAPFSEFASATAKLYNHPLSPFVHTPMAQRISAGLDTDDLDAGVEVMRGHGAARDQAATAHRNEDGVDALDQPSGCPVLPLPAHNMATATRRAW